MDTFASLDLTKTYTYADYLHWKFTEAVELIKGKIMRMSPAPTRYHQRLSTVLTYQIYAFLKGKNCQLFHAPFDVRLPRKNNRDEDIIDVVQPDLCVICDLAKLDDRGCIGAPDWIIEILSPGNSKKEMRYKYDLYQEAGVREYWVIDTNYKTVYPYLLKEGQFVGLAPMIEDDMVSPVIFPDLKIDLLEVFKDQ
jgi:Uma2 family endonuclease